MSKPKTQFVCAECGGVTAKWQGQCPQCTAWNTLSETVAESIATHPRFQGMAGGGGQVVHLSSVTATELPRIATGNSELDRALGGGLVPGGVVLLGGDPGIGKSTLLLQVAASIGSHRTVLYVTGEESAEQVALRARRLHVPTAQVRLLPEIRLETVLAAIEREHPHLLIVDSIQTLYTDTLSAAPGSVSQVRECAAMLTRAAKTREMSVVIVGHVTKDGAIAGPRVLEHIVDTVLQFEGDSHSSYRLLRAVKNRFGASNELGVLAMTESGLRAVSNPSAIFLPRSGGVVPGTTVVATMEGTRPLLLEVQALVDFNGAGGGRRTTQGFDSTRLAMLLAVLHRHAGANFAGADVFVNIVGGVKITDPAADLAVALSVMSSLKNKALRPNLVVLGEVGLGGEVRPIQRGLDRAREALKLGFDEVLMPAANLGKVKNLEGKLVPVGRVDEALDQSLP